MAIFKSCWRNSIQFRLGLGIMAVLVLAALLAPLVYRNYAGAGPIFLPGQFAPWLRPSVEHPLGTGGNGRDLLTDLLAGLSTTLQIGFLAGFLGTAIGIIVGFVSGYSGGALDAGLIGLTNILLVVPTYPLLVGLNMVLPRVTLPMTAVILAIFSWPFSARTIRAQVLSMKERTYIDLARVSGQSHLRIIFEEILPNMVPYLAIGFAFSTVGAMVAEVGLSAIGLGSPYIVTLGQMIAAARGGAVISMGRAYLLILPVSILILIFMSISLVARGMEDYLNPRLQNITGK
jgi:peptide/nickel transport system permease protein